MGFVRSIAVLAVMSTCLASAEASTIRLRCHGWQSAPVGCFEEGTTDTLVLFLSNLLGTQFGPSPYHFGILSQALQGLCPEMGSTEASEGCTYQLTAWFEPGDVIIGQVDGGTDQNAHVEGAEWLGHLPTDFDAMRIQFSETGACATTREILVPLRWSLANPDARIASVVAWGDNTDHQCEPPPPNNDVIAVACGHNHNVALRASGTIEAWGLNDFGQCNVPVPNEGFVAVAAGNWHSLALKADGTIVAWGRNLEGQCDVPAPNGGFARIEAGAYHSVALRLDGSIAAWGLNSDHQCEVPSPNSSFIAVAAGHAHSLGLRGDGTIAAWGLNADHQCDVPPFNTGFRGIAAGFYHSLGLRTDGTIVAWGSNHSGEIEVPSPNADFVGIAGGHWHSLGLKRTGTVIAWGYDHVGQCDVPSPNSGFLAVSAGVYHSIGLRDATVGACCLTDGSCASVTHADCDASGGTWQGMPSICSPNPCAQQPGACCLHSFCTSLTETDCHGYGGSYEGNGTVCTDSTCATSGVDLPAAGRGYQVTASPNPFSGSTTISFWLAQPGWTAVSVYDAAGRLLRVLGVGAMEAGAHSVLWDGCDDSGRKVAPSSYWVRIDTRAESQSGRIARMR